ncbi:hypothetical protein SLEP1_g6024 [Rubroshorea leprosula]|uniref:Pentatricopeptide repeat-containing protein n=2 Tax=Rubroshorea leprosula TaxID=152421 RepID=A0AAV5I4H3_9ROSI|nr:hypothetical protein SLEP1_g6024 [Rubroshorea leprosula]
MSSIPQNSPSLSCLELCKSTREMKQLQALTMKTRPIQIQLLYSKIMSAGDFSSPESLSYARSIVKHVESPDIVIYNALIKGFSGFNEKSSSFEAMALFKEMMMKGLVPDTYTLPYVLKACAQCQSLSHGEQVHGHSIKTGLSSSVYIVNTLMRLYAVCGIIVSVRKVFDYSSHRDLVSWTTLIQALVKMGHAREAINVFFQMCRENLIADQRTMVIVLSACARLGDLSLGTQIHRYMHDNIVDYDVFVGNALVDMYLKCGHATSARKVFGEMPVRNVVSWNSLISGLAQQGQFKEALDVFYDMQTIGLKPDSFTLVAVLNACANLGILELGKWIHAYMDKNHIPSDGFIGNALVDMYSKCGSIEEAFKVFQGMKCRDVYSYTAMIVGLAMHGEAERALQIFSLMPQAGVKPDEVTFVGVLSACSHAGLVEEGRQHFQDMSKVYNLKPQTEHYGCMVDLLGRAGLIREAEEFILQMPIEPDAFVWGALLGACRIHTKVELGETVMGKLMDIEPGRDGAYILMSNIYSSANRWKDALKMRKIMKERNLKKTPGCSSIEVDGIVHEFQKGDNSHPRNIEIRMLLEQMALQLHNYGHFDSTVLPV